MIEKPGRMDREAVFQVRDLTKVYRMGEMEVHALRGIEMELYAGELIVLLGPSGSGKSTLLNILGGLDTATQGVVSYRGRDLTRADEDDADRIPPLPRRIRLSVLQPDFQPHGQGERRGGHGNRAEPDGSGGGPGARRPGGPSGPFPGTALRG